MKITKKIEKEIMQVMDDYWNSYLNGDLKTWASYLPNDYRNIGTTKAEIWNSKKEIVDFTEKVIDQTVGMAEIRNKKTQIIPYDPYIMVHELGDLHVKAEESWIFYAQFRLSSLLENTKDGWKILHQHGSYPDSKAEEGEAFGFDELKAENKKLRDAIKARTIELERKNRELEIEAALERTRTQSMLMQHSGELDRTIQVFHEQLHLLDITSEFSYLWLPDEEKSTHLFWATWFENQADKKEKINGHPVSKTKMVVYPLDKTEPSIAACYVAWESGETIHVNPIPPEGIKEYFDTWEELLRGAGQFKAENFQQGVYYIDAYMKYGCFGIMIRNPLSEEEKKILSRFTKEFERTYTRFLDLQKAETQAREAQIEAAVERVRAAAMAMYSSEDFRQVNEVLWEQVKKLKITGFAGAGIALFDQNDHITWWDFSSAGNIGQHEHKLTHYNFKKYPLLGLEIWEAYQKGEPYYVLEYDLPRLKRAAKEWAAINPLIAADFEKAIASGQLTYQWGTCGRITNGFLTFDHLQQPDEDAKNIMVKMASAFELAYQRFLDLKKAEAQAREKEIELGLEKVRARAMAMRSSEELADLVKTVFDELTKLDFAMKWCMINIINESTRDNTIWAVNPDVDKAPESYQIKFGDWPYHQASFSAYQERKTKFVYVLEGKEKVDFEEFMFNETDVAKISDEAKEATRAMKRYVHSYSFCNFGGLQTVSETPLSEESLDILARFGKVFDLTYTRFNDLKLAEAQAREAQIEVALEKVRSRTMAMHSPDELEEVVAVVAEKLQDLGIILDANGVILCTYFKDSRDVMHWISAPDFSGSGRYLLPYFDHPIFRAAWESKESGDDYFSKAFSVEEKNSFFEYAFEHSDYKHFPEEFKEWVFQNDKHSLSFAWSENSAILIPSHTGVVPSEIDQEILKRFAKVFEQAYVRFMDLQTKEEQAAKIAEEKQRLEKTLYDLQTTQKQLIQSEKMASLGELTAGIAHEIQNPLNFVNNFSEVSHEILDEMIEEIEKGDFEEVKAIASDIKQNLEKINHHGKRADAIVKGMLQHSRLSSGEKTPTDINKLADEYLRLAYHGLRAKDKTFNATLNTEFDPRLEKAMVIPQDLGRVILNLVTNAFYACAERSRSAIQEKHKQKPNGYQPTVSIITKKSEDHITITVEDNGNGIPQKILDKIFQPFFTTKPTGQGTGLGLSLAFDIVTKGHGGKMNVKTEEGVGSTFTIVIPEN